MSSATLSSKYQLVIPKAVREQMGLRPGMTFEVITKGRVIYLVPQRPIREYRGIARGINPEGLRDKKDRF
jgi:AbrB family looped-hinge helix DNA binding protein